MPKRKLRVLKSSKTKEKDRISQKVDEFYEVVWKKPVEEALGETEARLRIALENIMSKRKLTDEQERLLEEITRIQKSMKKIGEKEGLTDGQKLDMLSALNSDLRKKIGHLEATLKKR